jgi:Cu/Ag efflux protein CusF
MNTKMKKIETALGLAVAVFVSMITSYAQAQERTPISVTEAVTVRATIVAIDKDNRIVTLKGPKGNLVELRADESIRRFNELKVGDIISATYSESVAVQVRRPGEPAPEKERVVVRPQSRPGASVENIMTRTVTVEEIDRTASTVTVKDTEGNLRSYRVRDPNRLEGVNVGDKVDIYYTTAILLKVD